MAVGMPELVTKSLPDYEALALKIARPRRCAHNPKTNRRTEPLFKTAEFTRHIEAAYARMSRHYRDGRTPASFAVTADNQIVVPDS